MPRPKRLSRDGARSHRCESYTLAALNPFLRRCLLRGEQAAWGEKEAEIAPGGCALILTDAPPPTPVLDLRHVCSVGGRRGM